MLKLNPQVRIWEINFFAHSSAIVSCEFPLFAIKANDDGSGATKNMLNE